MARTNNSKINKNTSKTLMPAKNAERERSRVRSLRNAFQTLQSCLPSVPPDTKLSKLDILILATNYISILMQTLGETTKKNIQDSLNLSSSSTMTNDNFESMTKKSNHSFTTKVYRPIKKWPMRSRLYSMIRSEHLLDDLKNSSFFGMNNNELTLNQYSAVSCNERNLK